MLITISFYATLQFITIFAIRHVTMPCLLLRCRHTPSCRALLLSLRFSLHYCCCHADATLILIHERCLMPPHAAACHASATLPPAAAMPLFSPLMILILLIFAMLMLTTPADVRLRHSRRLHLLTADFIYRFISMTPSRRQHHHQIEITTPSPSPDDAALLRYADALPC